MKKPTAAQALLILAALLAPIFGGYVFNDRTAVDPNSLLGSMGDGQAPILQHVLIALPAFLSLSILFVQRRVQQIPHPHVALALMIFVAALAPSVAFTEYRAVAVNSWIEWAAYAVAYLACIAGLGRRVGPIALLGAVFAGSAWIARSGVLEYLDMRRVDPTWRIFCGWSNPNAAAAMLVLGFFCALGLPRLKERSANLLLDLGVIVGGGLVLGALSLTGSKGGAILALPTGLVMFGLVGGKRHPAIFALAFVALGLSAVGFLKSMPLLGIGAALLFAVANLWPHRQHLMRLGGAVAFAVLLLAFFSSTTPGGKSVTSASRMSAAAETQDQSSVFRLNLWKSSIALAKERPVSGWGLGSYRYESARPGIVTATVFSHNTYLQLAAEAGLGALALFGAFVVLWTRRVLRGSSRLPDAQRLPFSAALGGIAAILAHCLVDSDLSYFGLGLSFAFVLGAATLLAADAVAPEFIPRPSRLMAAGGVMALWLLFAYLAWGDLAKSEVRFAQGQRQTGDLASIESLAGWDGDAAYLLAFGESTEEGRLSRMRQALALQPTPRNARAVATLQERSGNPVGAISTLKSAFDHDPNNLPTLLQLMQAQKAFNAVPDAEATARRIVAVENGPYYKIRSLDQVVPTETFSARLYLAEREKDERKKTGLLADAVRGFQRYAEVTVPEVLRAIKGGGSDYAGETLEKAQKRIAEASAAAAQASALFRKLGDATSADEMDGAAKVLAAAIPATTPSSG